MSVLGRGKIRNLLKEEKMENRLIFTPLLNDGQIGPGSIDIRLGNEFIVRKKGNTPFIDPSTDNKDQRGNTSTHIIRKKDPFYLHPNELVLASSLEYVKLPANVSATVTSRSRWGRAGLVIATATAIHPGFTGTITLELVNLGEVPLVLYHGISIAQIIFMSAEDADSYNGVQAGKTGPDASSVKLDGKEIKFWTK